MDSSKQATVTVIVPAWLRDAQDIAWLDEALESVFSQTVFCKCVVIENGSEFLPDISGPLFSIIHSEKGLSKARNAGVKASTTELFFPLDANDWLPPDALEVAVKKMPAKGFLYGATMLFHGERGSGDQHFYEAKPYDFQEVLKMVYFPNGALQRKADWEKIGGWRESLPFLEDWDYWITAGELGICGTPIQDTLYWYRQHGGIVQTHTHTPQWEETKKLIQSYHSNVYKGVYPPMCCGNKPPVKSSTSASFSGQSAQSAPVTPGAAGMVLIEYIGGNVGKMSFYGAVTKTRYVFGGSQRQGYIDAADEATGIRLNPGFLELSDHGAAIFRRV